jgi:ABC-2 type transport system permease protein
VAVTAPAMRTARARDIVRLKVRLLRNSLRGQSWRIALFVIGLVIGVGLGLIAGLLVALTGVDGSDPARGRDIAYLTAIFLGAGTVLAWALFPLLFFGVDETIDPARFALLPVPRRVLLAGMLGAAFVGVPALATFLATAGLAVSAGLRFGLLNALVSLVCLLAGLLLGVVASRALTSAFAAMLRSRKMRDLAAIFIAVAASMGAPLQWFITGLVTNGSMGEALSVARVLAWTPFGAAYAIPFDVAEGRPGAAALRSLIVLATLAALLWWWSSTLESAMIGITALGTAKRAVAAGGAVAALIPRALRGVVPGTPFGAIFAREWRSWWRDARRRASMFSVLIASAVVPIAVTFSARGGAGLSASATAQQPHALVTGYGVTFAGTIGGMLLANQFAFDGNAYAAHLLVRVPGRVELRARAAALAALSLPLIAAVTVAIVAISGAPGRILPGLGLLATGFGAAIAAASLLSVLAAYPMPDVNNPFALNSGTGSAKGLLAIAAMLATAVISTPVTLASAFLHGPVASVGVLLIGLAYGGAAMWLGTYIAGDVLDRRGPELLAAVTPRR